MLEIGLGDGMLFFGKKDLDKNYSILSQNKKGLLFNRRTIDISIISYMV